MSLPVTPPYVFGNVTSSIPLANLDADFATIYAAVNGIGNGTVALANVTITGGTITNVSDTSVSYTATKVISTSSNVGAYSYGTLSYSDVNLFESFTASANTYVQNVLQNTNSGTAASVDYVVSNNLGTATTYYGDYGMNSSGWTGTAGTNSFNAPNMVYLTSTTADLLIGTTTSNAVRFAVNGGADSAYITSGGVFTIVNDAVIHGLTVGLGGGSVSTNTVVGTSALAATNSGGYCSAFGYQALASNTSGLINDAFGYGTMVANTSGSYNSSFGTQSLTSNTTGSNNVAMGYLSLKSNTTASNNTAVGYQAGYSGTTGTTYSTYVGALAGYNNTGQVQCAIGYQALYSNTTGSDNTAVGGYQTLYSNTTGSYNVAIGRQALQANTTASNNTAVGYQAGYSNTTGIQSVFIGQGSGYSTTGSYNTFVGQYSGYNLTSGIVNTFVGQGAGQAMTTGSKNTIIGGFQGNQGGLDIRTASNYIVLSDGDGNPRGVFDGSGRFLINTNTASLSFGSGLVAIKNNGDNALQIEMNSNNSGLSVNQNTVSGTYLCNFGYRSSVVGSIQTNGTTTSYNTTSDQRLKTDKGIATDTSVIDNTVVHDFAWKQDGSIDKGVFAQEAILVKPSAVTKGQNDNLNANGLPQNPWEVDYSKYVPDLIVYCQQLKATIVSLEAKLKSAGVAGF